MPVIINDVKLLPGVEQYMNYTHVTEIYYNDVKVYQYDNQGPVITVTSSTADTANPEYVLTGTVVDSDSTVDHVEINGETVAVSNDTFSKSYTLSLGENVFAIVAEDSIGNVGSITFSINLVPTT